MILKHSLAVVVLLIASMTVSAQDIDLSNVVAGDVIDSDTPIPDGAVINLNGGSIAVGTESIMGVVLNINSGDVGLDVEISNSTINIAGGQVAVGAANVAEGVNNFSNDITVTDGEVGGFFQLRGNSTLQLSGGSIESFGTLPLASATVSGGSFILVDNNGELNLSGGDFSTFRTLTSDSAVNLFGSDFAIDGVPVAGLTEGVAFDIGDQLAGQVVTLSGTLSDGSAFSTLLDSTREIGELSFGPFDSTAELEAEPGFVFTEAAVNVTLVQSIPEPNSFVLLALASCAGLVRRRR